MPSPLEQERYANAARVPQKISDDLHWCPRCSNLGMDPDTGEPCPCQEGQVPLLQSQEEESAS